MNCWKDVVGQVLPVWVGQIVWGGLQSKRNYLDAPIEQVYKGDSFRWGLCEKCYNFF